MSLAPAFPINKNGGTVPPFTVAGAVHRHPSKPKKATMQNAFKIKAKIAARGAAIEAARALIRPTMLRQPVLARVFNSMPTAIRSDARISMSSVSIDTVYISVFIRGLDSFKDKRLTSVLEKFADWQGQSTDYTSSTQPNRDFNFTRTFTWEHDTRSIAYKKLMKEVHLAPSTFDICVCIYAYVKEDSSSCRIVTKEREETIKKVERFIVCN